MRNTAPPKARRRVSSPRERELYFDLHKQVDELIPSGYIDDVKETHLDQPVALIMNVRQRRTYHLPLLVKIVRVCLPDFVIEGRFLEAVAEIEAAEEGATA